MKGRKMSGVFLCHSSKDKPFVRRLAYALDANGIKRWLDESELLVGDSLIGKISEAILEMEYLAVILSPDSVSSKWVAQELEIAMSNQLQEGRIKVLPILYRDCDLPPFLVGKLYLDFRDPSRFDVEIIKLLARFTPRVTQRPELITPISTGRLFNESKALVTKDLSVNIDKLKLIDKINISINSGEILGIIGPSGSGKSILANVLTGNHAFNGSIGFPGFDTIYTDFLKGKRDFFPNKIIKLVCMPGPKENRIMKQNIYSILKKECFDKPRHIQDEKIEYVLHLSGAWDVVKYRLNGRLESFDIGTIIRVLLAKALIVEPKIVFLDHILDVVSTYPSSRIKFLQTLFDLNANGMTIIATAGNDFRMLAPWCDRIALMSFGKIVMVDTPANLVRSKETLPLLQIDDLYVRA